MELKEFCKRIASLRDQLLVRARQMSGDDDTAEDLVQETLLQLWTMRDKLDRHPNPTALAMTVLHNKAVDQLRRNKQTLMQPINDNAITTEQPVDLSDDVALIRHIVDQLPPLQAQVFRLKEIEGYEAQEIMDITGCSADSLRQNLSRARRRIREEYIKITMSQR